MKSDQPIEIVTLIPMGATRQRISAFPVIGNGPDAHAWADAAAPSPLFQVSGSHFNNGDTTDATADGLVPWNSHDQEIPRFTWWPNKGSKEWIQLEFPKSREVSRVEVYCSSS